MLAALLAIIATVWLLYARSLSFPFVIDDYVQIAENPAVIEGAPLSKFFLDRDTTSSRPDYNTRIYRPLRNVAFRALVRAFGASPLVFRLANYLLYAAAIGLVFALGWHVLPSLRAALMAAAVFAVLPVHVEPVVYPSALGDLLSLDLELLGLICGWRAFVNTKGFALAAAASVIFLALAMTAKEMAITGPGLLALLWLHRRPASMRQSFALLLVLALVAASYLALRTHVVGQMGQEPITWESVQRGLKEAPALLLGYLQIAVMPFGHKPSYVVPTPSGLGAVLMYIGFGLAAWLLRRTDKQHTPPGGLALWLAWFVMALVPVLHLVPLWADLADRFVLVSTVGLALAAGEVGERLLQRFSVRIVLIPAAAVMTILCLGVWFEQEVWRSDHALWRYGVQAEPRASLAQSNFCLSALQLGQYEQALHACDKAFELGRDNAEIHGRRAVSLQALGRLHEAEVAARRSLKYDPQQVQMQAVMGDLALARSDIPEVTRRLQMAKQLAPQHPSTTLLEAAWAKHENRFDDALTLYNQLLGRVPGVPRFHVLAVETARAANNAEQVTKHCRSCLAFEPAYQPCLRVCEQRTNTAPTPKPP